MNAKTKHRPGERILFSPFELRPAERLLLREGAPLPLGSRAMDILLCLIEREGEVVSPDELLSHVWRGISVEPGALRVQISALRKVLHDEPHARYVSTIPGRGYCFVGRTLRQPHSIPADPPNRPDYSPPPKAFPAVVGRDLVIDELERLVAAERFVTIVGAGGIGKTTVALALGRRMSAAFAGDVALVDLAVERSDANVANAVAAALRISGVGGAPLAGLASQLRSRRLLLILDNCEHLISGAAALAEVVCRETAHVRILATSREPLYALGEQVHRLAPLEAPPSSAARSFDDVSAYPAAQLFIQRVTASGGHFEHRSSDSVAIAEICRKLDGIPLAIELAAGQVHAFGLATTLALLDSELRLSWPGRRTATPRHVTLNAALAWSYRLLSAEEAKLLRTLSAFVGAFTLNAAETVADDDRDGLVAANLPGLVSKSLVSTDRTEGGFLYRLLDTTRAYAGARLAEAGERDRVAARHALFSLEALSDLLEDPKRKEPAGSYAAVIAALAEVRGALDWAFTKRNDTELGVRLAASAALALLMTSQFAECRRWTELGLANLGDEERGGRAEMMLQASFGLSRMLAGGNTSDVEAALVRSLELADRLGEDGQMMPVLSGLSLFRHRAGDARRALAFAERAERVAMALDDATSLAVANDMLATSHHLMGNHRLALWHSMAVLRAPPPSRRFDHAAFGLEYRNRALSTLARVYWLNGRFEDGVALARQAIEEAAELEHPIGQAVVLSGVLPIFLWIGDLEAVSDYVARLREIAQTHDIRPHRNIGLAFQGMELIHRGHATAGVRLMEEAFRGLENGGNRLMRILLGADYVEGLFEAGDLEGAVREVENLLALTEETGYRYNLPELLRLKAEGARRLGGRAETRPGKILLRAVALARRQDAHAWALRSAIALLELRIEKGRPDSAARLVSALLARISFSTPTPDRLKANRLLETLECSAAA